MLGSLIKDLFARRHAESQGVGNTATGSKGELSGSNPRPMRCEIVRPAPNSPLLQYRNNVTSQFGEDGIIAHVLDVIRPTHNYCIEFGAWDGKYLSNCYNLLTNAGAVVSYHDPHVPEITEDGHELRSVELEPAAYDCTVIVTDNGDVDYARLVEQAPVVVDLRNATGRAGIASDKVWKL